jgi:hypothetical protein
MWLIVLHEAKASARVSELSHICLRRAPRDSPCRPGCKFDRARNANQARRTTASRRHRKHADHRDRSATGCNARSSSGSTFRRPNGSFSRGDPSFSAIPPSSRTLNATNAVSLLLPRTNALVRAAPAVIQNSPTARTPGATSPTGIAPTFSRAVRPAAPAMINFPPGTVVLTNRPNAASR